MAHRRSSRPRDWPDWFQPKRYPHFDQPLRDPTGIRELVESATRVARHAFLPFISFERVVRKYKREQGQFVRKVRPLSCAGHLDSQIFRRYGLLLGERYEPILGDRAIGTSVLAYRRFNPPKCNIHFANDAFLFIEQHAPCVAMAFDVRDFFESLDHKLLKRAWKDVLGVTELPADHYAVFRAITRYAFVNREELLRVFAISKKKLANWRGPICSPEQFRDVVRRTEKLIEVKSGGKGIPQGSPMSAILSNIYMLTLDAKMALMAGQRQGRYYRYSDDILVVCPPDAREVLEKTLRSELGNLGLEIHDGPGKSTIATFTVGDGGSLDSDRPLQYLGFTFDGRHVRVRSHTLARYLRRMQKAVRRERFLAEKGTAQGDAPRVRRKLLYSRYTHLGSRNFISYTKKAREVFKGDKIRDQVKRHWKKLHALLEIQ